MLCTYPCIFNYANAMTLIQIQHSFIFLFRVDEDLTIKVADATLSRDIYELEYYKPGEKARALPVKWMSPEALEHELFTSKGDVVSSLNQLQKLKDFLTNCETRLMCFSYFQGI